MLRSVFQSGVVVGLVRLGGALAGLLVTAVLGRLLGAERLGIYGYTIICLTLLSIPVSYGWATLLLRRVGASFHDNGWNAAKGMTLLGNRYAVVVTLVVFFLAGLAFLLFRDAFPAYLSPGLLLLLAVVLFLDQLSALRLAILRGLNHPVWGQLPEMLIRPLLVVGLFLLIADLSGQPPALHHAYWSLLIASAASLVAGVFFLRMKSPSAFNTARPVYKRRQWLISAVTLTGNSGLLILNAYIDILVLGVLGSFEQVGVYRVAVQIALFSGFVYTALNMIAGQRFASLHASGELVKLQSVAVFMARVSLVGALLLPLLFLFAGEHVLAAVFGQEFVAAEEPLKFLFLGQMINAGVGMVSTLMIMSGRETRIIRFTLASVVLNAVLCIFLVPSFGSTGAALSNLVSTGLFNIAIWIYALRTLGVDTSVLGLKLAKTPTEID